MDQPNLNYIDELSGGDEMFKKKLLDIIVAELPEEIKAYHFSMQKGHYDKAARDVHKLKHKISILGMFESLNVAERYEESLRKKEVNDKDKFEKILLRMTLFISEL